MEQNQRLKRESNIEILRIISMILIICSHYFAHGGVNYSFTGENFRSIAFQILTIGRFGNAIFVIISGYFLINSKFKIKKLFQIILETVFYSLLFLILFSAFGKVELTLKLFINQVFALFTTGDYWFVSVYIIIYILSPFINKLIKSLNRNQNIALFCVMFLMVSVIPFVSNFIMPSYLKFISWWGEVFGFILLYHVGALVKMFGFFDFEKNYKNFVYSLMFFIITCLLMVVYNFMLLKFDFVTGSPFLINHHNSPFIILSAVYLVSFFKNLKIKNLKFINIISSTTLGIYFIHENVFVRPYLWGNVLRVSTYAYSNLFVVHLIGSVLVVFIGSVILDLVRQFVFEKPLFKVIDKPLSSFQRKLDEFIKD